MLPRDVDRPDARASRSGGTPSLPSIEVATEDFTGLHRRMRHRSTPVRYMNTISWLSPTTPQPMEINPRVSVRTDVRQRPERAPSVSARMRKSRSILDSVRDDVTELEGGLGARDRTRLNDYLRATSVKSSSESSGPNDKPRP